MIFSAKFSPLIDLMTTVAILEDTVSSWFDSSVMISVLQKMNCKKSEYGEVIRSVKRGLDLILDEYCFLFNLFLLLISFYVIH